MVPEEWPIAAAPDGRDAGPARRAERSRLSTVRADFFLDPAERLTEQERALMTRMLSELVGGTADEIELAAGDGRAAVNDRDRSALVRRLGQAGLLDDPQLIELLLRRADEERVAAALRARSGARSSLLQSLVAADSAPVAAAAMALILARGRRRDRFGQIRVDFNDLPVGSARRLAFAVAAALRPANDQRLAAAASALVERHDGSKSSDGLTHALAGALAAESALDEALLVQMAEQGEVGLLAEAIAQLCGVQSALAWDHLLAGGDGRMALLLRIAGLSRRFAGALLALLCDLAGITDPGAEIARFDTLEEADAERQRTWLQLAPPYRAAAAVLDADRG
ncbi:DUF2336 domain-containing protein [Sphingomonas sp.]|uniref:DUF2336 domain-containing protein n=1 Tax=Sphingomonas sp. TaxID=28214 RepID=UPI00286DB949|nr:DUF2336 domain-containing protein [Sphingomonas sp.]